MGFMRSEDMFLYDVRYNLKTDTNYAKLEGIFGVSWKTLAGYKSKKQAIRKHYHILDDDAPITLLKELYAKVKYDIETWKIIEGSDDKYMVSNYGRFKRVYKSGDKFVMPYFQARKVNVNKNKQFVKVKFKGIYKEYNVARLVAYHFVDIYYDSDGWTRKGKALKYKKYTHDDVAVYHKNGIVHDNYHANLEYLDREDLGKKTAYKSKGGKTIVAINADTDEVIDYFRSTRHVESKLPISKQSVCDSLNGIRPIVGGIYKFKYEE